MSATLARSRHAQPKAPEPVRPEPVRLPFFWTRFSQQKKGRQHTVRCDMCMYAIHTDCDSPPPAPPELVSMGRTHVLQLDTSTAPPPQTKTHHSRDTSVPGERFSSCCFKWLVHRRGPWAPGRLPYAPAGGGGRWLSCAVLRSSASPSLSIISCTHSEMASEMAGETRPSEGGA